MVVEIRVRDCHEVSCVRQIDKTIVGVLANSLIDRQVAVVNPYIGRLIDGNGIAIGGKHLGDLQVPDNDVLLTENGKTMPLRAGKRQQSINKIVAGNGFDVQLPVFPTMVLSEVTDTFAAPLMAPWTTITRAPAALAAAES